ncbi:MAG: hypothetical protein U9Q40_06355 [Campylobacterota bacterium]|nr:hypothetical protein [Campylobacterota bacterium]
MKTREFTFKTQTLEIDYNSDLTVELIEDYIYEDLEVPQECIESLNISNRYVNIKLSHTQRYFNDDWYVNLQRVG